MKCAKSFTMDIENIAFLEKVGNSSDFVNSLLTKERLKGQTTSDVIETKNIKVTEPIKESSIVVCEEDIRPAADSYSIIDLKCEIGKQMMKFDEIKFKQITAIDIWSEMLQDFHGAAIKKKFEKNVIDELYTRLQFLYDVVKPHLFKHGYENDENGRVMTLQKELWFDFKMWKENGCEVPKEPADYFSYSDRDERRKESKELAKKLSANDMDSTNGYCPKALTEGDIIDDYLNAKVSEEVLAQIHYVKGGEGDIKMLDNKKEQKQIEG